MAGDVGVCLHPHLCLSVLCSSHILPLPCVRWMWSKVFAPFSVQGQSWQQELLLCSVWRFCVPPASPVSMQQGPELFLPFCKFLPPGVKGDTVPWWLAASGSSSVHSSFSVVENNDSRAIQKHSPWGEGPSTPAELCALSPDPPGTARWPWDGGAGCPLCPWAGWSWEVGSKQRAGAQGKQGDRTAAGCSQSGASFCNGSENVSAGRRGAWLDMQAKCPFPLQDPGSLLHSLSS